jgi:hypothetical protein
VISLPANLEARKRIKLLSLCELSLLQTLVNMRSYSLNEHHEKGFKNILKFFLKVKEYCNPEQRNLEVGEGKYNLVQKSHYLLVSVKIYAWIYCINPFHLLNILFLFAPMAFVFGKKQ